MEPESHILQYSLSRSKHIKFFILEYYTGAGSVYIWIRGLGGPFLVFMGFHYLVSNERYSVYFGVFCVLFGLYYAIRPLLTVLLNKGNVFIDSSVTLSIGNNEMHCEINASTFNITYRQISEFSKRKWYYIIKASKNRSIFIPPDKMQQEWSDAFREKQIPVDG